MRDKRPIGDYFSVCSEFEDRLEADLLFERRLDLLRDEELELALF